MTLDERYDIRKTLWYDGPHSGWLAFDRVLCREVVLNLPYQSKHNERFLAAAQLRARLRHINLIPIYDFSVTREGQPFFTEPHLQTLSLYQVLRGEPDGILWKRVHFLLQVCEALHFVHTHELLHLDVAPENVLISQPFEEIFLVRGHPSLPAAQMACERDSRSSAVRITYMAPELIDLDRLGPATAATDVYGLGGILYCILYGNFPNGRSWTEFGARERVGIVEDETSWADIVESLTNRNGPPSRGCLQCTGSHSLKLAKKLEPICLRALHSDRVKRQQTVAEFSNDLIGAVTH